MAVFDATALRHFLEPDARPPVDPTTHNPVADTKTRIECSPHNIWSFAVSGYRVLPRWIEARAGVPAHFGFVTELRDTCGRIAELIDLFDRADIVLEKSLRATLTREVLRLDG